MYCNFELAYYYITLHTAYNAAKASMAICTIIIPHHQCQVEKVAEKEGIKIECQAVLTEYL